MKTLSRIFTVLLLAGAAPLMAADGDSGTATNTAAKGGERAPRTQERGERGPRGGHHGPGGRFSMLICPNCHHRLIVLAPDGHGRGGREGREGREGRGERGPRGPRGAKRGGQKGPRTQPQSQTTPAEN